MQTFFDDCYSLKDFILLFHNSNSKFAIFKDPFFVLILISIYKKIPNYDIIPKILPLRSIILPNNLYS